MEIPIAYASEVPEAPKLTPEGLISSISAEYGVSSTTLYNLAYSESHLDPSAVGDSGDSVGIVQIRLKSHPDVSREQALDPEFSLRWAALEILAGNISQWSVCSCVKTIAPLVSGMPIQDADKFIPNADVTTGKVLLLNYHGVRHVALIKEVSKEGILVYEGNYKRCLTGTRLISWEELGDTLVGYYSP